METTNRTAQQINDKIILTVQKLKEKVESANKASRGIGLSLVNQEKYPSVVKFLGKEGANIERTMSEPVEIAENLRDLGKELAKAIKGVSANSEGK